jgi:predicted SAM-dependent methyltransferase
MKLDIGSGKTPVPGYTGVDLFAEGDGIIHAPMWSLPFEDGTIEAINSSHALEHIEKRAVVTTLQEFYRVLQIGGILDIEVPSLVWCCENFLKHQDDPFARDIIFGNQDPPGGQFHMTGYTFQIMVDYLHQAGFKDCSIVYGKIWSHEQECLQFRVIKQ